MHMYTHSPSSATQPCCTVHAPQTVLEKALGKCLSHALHPCPEYPLCSPTSLLETQSSDLGLCTQWMEVRPVPRASAPWQADRSATLPQPSRAPCRPQARPGFRSCCHLGWPHHIWFSSAAGLDEWCLVRAPQGSPPWQARPGGAARGGRNEREPEGGWGQAGGPGSPEPGPVIRLGTAQRASLSPTPR